MPVLQAVSRLYRAARVRLLHATRTQLLHAAQTLTLQAVRRQHLRITVALHAAAEEASRAEEASLVAVHAEAAVEVADKA